MEETNGKEQSDIWPVSPPKPTQSTARSKVINNWNSTWKSMEMQPIIPSVDKNRLNRPLKVNKSLKKLNNELITTSDDNKEITKEVIEKKDIKCDVIENKVISNDMINGNTIKEPKVLAKRKRLEDNLLNEVKKQMTTNSQIIAKKKVNQIRGIKSSNVTIKRNRKRPVVMKNLLSNQSFLDFVSKKFQPIKEGVPFIQDRSCRELAKEYESSKLDDCLDCSNEKTRGDSQTCRFLQYRTLVKKCDKLSVYAFAEEGNATHDDCKLWLPMSPPKDLDSKTAIYLLIFVGQQFCQIYSEEKKIWQRFASLTWKRPVKGIRELCDNCQTTIFNSHYVCPKCGLAICVDCFDYRANRENSNIPLSHSSRKNHDDFGWVYCTDKECHDLNAFHLAIFLTQAVFGSIDTAFHRIRNEKQIPGLCECGQLLSQFNQDIRKSYENDDLTQIYPEVARHWLCNNTLLILNNPKCNENIKLFQLNWIRGYPVIIEKVNESLDQELWSPNSFNLNFGRHMSRLVDCMNGQIIPKRAMANFWNGFEDVDQRLFNDETGEQMILKLKDWPPNAEFRDMLPMWFDNLMDALPLPEYTRYNGNRNLASRLPEFFVRPDLGPKMYCAYGSVLHPEKGTTNLHLDMSDAVNVMIYVGIAQKNKKPLEDHINGANQTLLKGGCDRQMMERANSDGHKVGALWHIWKAEDANKIREFLNKVAKERNMKIEANNDPIHDQSWYLDQTLRTRLEEEHNVKGLAIAQCFGDAILVPAGAPHQVQNIHSCIKVAGEFVSPENVAHCLTMTQQFRNLSKRHNNHEDKLQIKNIIFHTIKDCLSALLPSNPNCFTIPSPPKLVSLRHTFIQNNEEFTSNGSSFQSQDVSMDELVDSDESFETPPPPPLQTPLSVNISEKSILSKISIESDISHNCVVNGECPQLNQCTDSLKCTPNDITSEEVNSESIETDSSKRCETESTQLLTPPPLVNPFKNSNDTIDEQSLSPPPVLTPYNDELLIRRALQSPQKDIS